MFDATPYREELTRRVEVIRRLLAASQQVPPASTIPDISRETRGLAIVLLFAAYENLLTSLCRGLLEATIRLRVANRRLRQGLRRFAAYGELESIRASSRAKVWKQSGPRLLECLERARPCTVNADLFPSDGSFMKKTQVLLFCDLFGLGDPGAVLREVWTIMDNVVTQRNGVAHGSLTPEEVGRDYSAADLDRLVNSWATRWGEFIDHVEARASSRDFYRLTR